METDRFSSRPFDRLDHQAFKAEIERASNKTNFDYIISRRFM
ncbi:hypothetical protein [Salipaludibacillus keqinensis]|nr:hypothetical protein [Salipaludibacillus keqinensis]